MRTGFKKRNPKDFRVIHVELTTNQYAQLCQKSFEYRAKNMSDYIRYKLGFESTINEQEVKNDTIWSSRNSRA